MREILLARGSMWTQRMGVKEQKDKTEEAKLENRFEKYKFSGAETQVFS